MSKQLLRSARLWHGSEIRCVVQVCGLRFGVEIGFQEQYVPVEAHDVQLNVAADLTWSIALIANQG